LLAVRIVAPSLWKWTPTPVSHFRGKGVVWFGSFYQWNPDFGRMFRNRKTKPARG
jgi:hypothetical protein